VVAFGCTLCVHVGLQLQLQMPLVFSLSAETNGIGRHTVMCSQAAARACKDG
jgi:hypothetical protein